MDKTAIHKEIDRLNVRRDELVKRHREISQELEDLERTKERLQEVLGGDE